MAAQMVREVETKGNGVDARIVLSSPVGASDARVSCERVEPMVYERAWR